MTSRCWKLGDNVSTDEIISTRCLTLTDKDELKRHIFKNIRPEIADKVQPGDILIAGENMGYGSSREHAPLALLGAGIKVIVACSFARLFFRNCINLGIAAVTAPEAVRDICEGDALEVDLQRGIIFNGTQRKQYRFNVFPDYIQKYLLKGGLINAINDERPE